MKASSRIRMLMVIGVLIGTLSVLLFLFFATRSAFDVWEKIQTLPEPFFYLYLIVLWSIIGFAIWLIYRLLFPKAVPTAEKRPVSRESITESLEQAESFGMDTDELRNELEELEARKAAGSVQIALFGDVSTGKSSIIKALLPDADIETHVRGGSTQEITEYRWSSSKGDQLVLTDLPGRNEADGNLDDAVRDEAIRAHVVVYVCDSDITRSQFDDIQLLKSFGKPMLVAINKVDRLNDEQKHQLQSHLQERLQGDLSIVFTQSGGMEELVRIYPDGREEIVQRPRKADVHEFAMALQDKIDDQLDVLESLRDASVFVLVKDKLDFAKTEFQREKALKIVKSSTRKAVLGAMASVSPGTDLVVQGALGSLMVRDLCRLYDVSPRQLDIDNFLNFSQGHLKKSIPLLLAVAGNGFKAFPGVGTVAGGLIHAVAYGIIFDALGRAVVKTLEERGGLKAAPASLTFKEMLSENLESRAKRFAKLVLDQRKE